MLVCMGKSPWIKFTLLHIWCYVAIANTYLDKQANKNNKLHENNFENKFQKSDFENQFQKSDFENKFQESDFVNKFQENDFVNKFVVKTPVQYSLDILQNKGKNDDERAIRKFSFDNEYTKKENKKNIKEIDEINKRKDFENVKNNGLEKWTKAEKIDKKRNAKNEVSENVENEYGTKFNYNNVIKFDTSTDLLNLENEAIFHDSNNINKKGNLPINWLWKSNLSARFRYPGIIETTSSDSIQPPPPTNFKLDSDKFPQKKLMLSRDKEEEVEDGIIFNNFHYKSLYKLKGEDKEEIDVETARNEEEIPWEEGVTPADFQNAYNIVKFTKSDILGELSNSNLTFGTSKRKSMSKNFPGERRPHSSSIRHQKSRKNFIRARKSPRTRSPAPHDDTESEGNSHQQETPSSDLHLKQSSGDTTDDIKRNENLNSPNSYQSVINHNDLDGNIQHNDYNNLIEDDKAKNDFVIKEALYDANIYDNKDYDNITKEEILIDNTPRVDKEEKMDVVTKFLRIVESQHLMGANCTKGTDFNLGEGVVDRYAQERFKLEALVAVNRANLYTRLWKYSREQVLKAEYLLHAEVLSIVEFDEDIFAAGNCYDKYEYKDYMLFCPFAYRLPEGPILVKDLAVEYKYLTESSEWFYIARKNAEKAIIKNDQIRKGYHQYPFNDSAHTEREEEEILEVIYEDGQWSKPYYDCGGGNIWMMTYTVPFFGYANNTYYFKGTSGIDIDLRRVDIDQCPIPEGSKTLNIFANSDKCKKRTTMCVSIKGLGFRRGSYKCVCKRGFYFPDLSASKKYFNGSHIEEEYEKILLGEPSIYEEEGVFECSPCAEGCETCESSTPCVVSLNWVMRTVILTVCLIIILSLPAILFFTWKYGNIKVVRAASPVLLRIIIVGAFFIYCNTLVLYPIPNTITCSVRVWLREIGFSLAYGALMLKTWRISVIFRVRSAKAVKITDLDLMKRVGIIVGVFSVFLGIRTIVAPPQVIVSMTADDLKAFLCSTDWWDHSFTFMEMMFLVWGIRLCIVVRKAPSEFNESRFISMAIYNEFLLSLFLNVSMIFLQSPANPDLLFIIFFCHTQLTITPLIALIFGSKIFMVIKGLGKGEDSMSMTKPMAAKFLQKPKMNSHNMGSITSSSGYNIEGDIQEEFKKIYLFLDSLRERNARLGNRHLVAKIIAMQQAAAGAVSVPPLETKEIKNTSGESKSKTEKPHTKVADGVVMKPNVNNILANVTDKIVCATFQETPEGYKGIALAKGFVEINNSDICTSSGNGSKDIYPNLTEYKGESSSDSLRGVDVLTEDQISTRHVCSNSNPSSLWGRRIDSLSECGSPVSLNSFPSPTSSPPQNVRQLSVNSCDSSKIRKRRNSANCDSAFRGIKEVTSTCQNESRRGSRSLENLLSDTARRRPASLFQRTEYDRAIWSSYSTTRHFDQYIEESSYSRQIKESARARAFILYSLTDRSSFSDEITV